ncbi:MAG: gluconate 2-dehydrogenase subunit 3 family protein [Bacteroidia bacterium]|nr:gluconate 2-dehydrogenase subunit 3 family protein [Bacteroidia bacterium]
MNRKKFIVALTILGGGSIASFYGLKYANSKAIPDKAFLDLNKELIADLCNVIIPKTDSPGAKEAKVEEYVIFAIKNSKDVVFCNNFINGLKEVKSYCQSNYQNPFSILSSKQQIEVVKHFKEEGINLTGKLGKVKNKILGKSFFMILKETTCIGYCTSVVGIKKGLAYEYVPTRFIGCTDYIKGQKSWATK